MYWTDKNLPILPDNIQETVDRYGKQKDYAHQADVLRIYLVYLFGGVYMDVDFRYINGLEHGMNLDQHDGFFCGHWGTDFTIPNGVFGCKKNHPLMKHIVDNINPNSLWHGPSWFGTIIKKYFNIEYEVNHDQFNNLLKENKFLYYRYSDFENKNYGHEALYSWSPENRKKFENGDFKW